MYKKTVTVLTSLLVLSSITSFNVNASDYSKDGLDVSFTTNSDSYNQLDVIRAQLSVTNNNIHDFYNVNLSGIIPDGYVSLEDETYSLYVDVLGRGETVTLDLLYAPDVELEEETFEVETTTSTPTSTETTASTTTTPTTTTTNNKTTTTTNNTTTTMTSSTSTTVTTTNSTVVKSNNTTSSTSSSNNKLNSSNNSDSPKTGDSDWIFIVPVSALAIMLITGNKKTKKLLSLVLATTIAGYSYYGIDYSIDVEAEESMTNYETIYVSEQVSVEGNELLLEGYVTYDADSLTDVGVLKASEEKLLANYNSDVLFTVPIEKDSDKIVNLYKDDLIIGKLNDRGEDGDAIKNDGIYSLKLSIMEDDSELSKYYVEYDSIKSNAISFKVYSMPTEEDINTYADVIDSINTINLKYADEEGYISDKNSEIVLSEITDYLDSLDSTIIDHYNKNDSSITIWFSSGLNYHYTINLKDTLSLGKNMPMSIYTYEPSNNILSYTKMARDEASRLSSIMPNYTYNHQYIVGDSSSNGDVTFNAVKQLAPNSIVLWHGHGGYDAEAGSILCVNESIHMRDLPSKPELLADVIQGAIFVSEVGMSSGWYEGDACITSKFIKKYCTDLSNSLIILDACHSAQDTGLANSFINNGAAAVIGYNDIVYTIYASDFTHTFFNKWLTKGEGLFYPSVLEAFTETYNELGSDHTTPEAKAVPILFGGESTKEFRVQYPNYDECGTIKGKITNYMETDKETSENYVSLYYRNELGILSAPLTKTKIQDDGSFDLYYLQGDYTLKIEVGGCASIIDNVTITNKKTTSVEYELVDGAGATVLLHGDVNDAVTGYDVEKYTLEFHNGFDNADSMFFTEANVFEEGSFNVSLTEGYYTAVIKADGYIKYTENVTVKNGMMGKSFGIMPDWPEGAFHVVLTWGAYPEDLDAHVKGLLKNGKVFHVYYNNTIAKEGSKYICELDKDCKEGFGPETITFTDTSTNTFYYYVNKYTASGIFDMANANISVYKGGHLIASYKYPKSLAGQSTPGSVNTYWNVFAIKGDILVPRNTLTSTPNLWYLN